MHKKITVSFFKVLISLSLVIVLTEGISFAANAGLPEKNSSHHFVGPGKLPPGVEKQIQETGEAEIIVALDVADIRAHAGALRQARRLKVDSREIIAEKSGLYKNRKDVVLKALAPFKHLLIHDYSALPVLHLKAGRAAIEKLMTMKEVLSVGENRAFSPFLLESLPLIQAPVAGSTGSGTSVAVLDTGVDYTLADFGSCTAPGTPASCKVAYVQDFAPNDGSLDDSGHGTNVSGIVVGVAPDTDILGLDVFYNKNAYDGYILDAINWVLVNKDTYHIESVNMSFGGGRYNSSCPSDPLAQAITDLKTAGITTVAASGNSAYTNAITSPACAPAAVSVGAVYDADLGPMAWSRCTDNTTAADQVACFSNSAPFMTLLAPGSEITAAGYIGSGTSMAAPFVSGGAAVLKGEYGSLTVDEVVSRLKFSGTPIMDGKSGVTKPRIDILAAVNLAEPYIEYTPEAFYFKVPEGDSPVDGTLGISFRGTGPFTWGVTDDASWISLSTAGGTDAGTVTVIVNVSGLAVGTYNAIITITSTDDPIIFSPVTVPVTLEIVDPTYVDDFESGDLSGLSWETGGNGSWAVQSVTKHSGTYAVKTPSLTDNQSSYLRVALNVTSAGYLRFWTRTSTEPVWDNVKLYIDSHYTAGKWDGWYGESDWFEDRSEYSVTPGIHMFTWVFSKDVNTSEGSDAVWLDDISFPPFNTDVPYRSVDPSSKNFGSVPVGGSLAVQTFTVSNTGTVNLIIGTAGLSGTDVSQFTKENDNCSGQTVLPSGTCTVDVRFTPLSTGAKSATLYVTSNYPESAIVPLSGTGVASYLLTVDKTGSTGTGTVTSDLAGISCGVDCSEPYPTGEVVTLTAVAGLDSTFAGWSGGGCSGTLPCEITMNSAATVTALFNLNPPVADFSGSILTGDSPLAVTFTDLSTNNPTAWSWDFGVSGTSSQQNPLHTFRTAGTYSVTLTASNAGGSDLETKIAYINVNVCGNDPVRISGVDRGSSIQTAYDNNAIEGDTINIQAVDFIEDLTLGRLITVTLAGGYNCGYTDNLSDSVILGSMTISDGTVTIDKITIQ